VVAMMAAVDMPSLRLENRIQGVAVISTPVGP
jgi:hypothetical protein